MKSPQGTRRDTHDPGHAWEIASESLEPTRKPTAMQLWKIRGSTISILADGNHADGVQSTGGGNVTVRRNFIDIADHGKGHGGGANSVFQIGTEDGSNSNWAIEGNWLNGGGWMVHVDASSGGNNRIVNNRFGRDYRKGPFSILGSWTVMDNVWDDNDQPALP